MSYPRLARALLHGQPYFGAALRALQGEPGRHRYFLPVVRHVAASMKERVRILEVGTWAGASAISWAKALDEAGCDGEVTCVDAWAPYFDVRADSGRHYEEMNEAARRGDVFRLFLHNVRASGVEHRVRWLVGDSREVLPSLPAEAFDVVYIDGAHTVEIVRADLAQGKRVLRASGVLCGDDLELQRDEVEPSEHLRLVAAGVDYALCPGRGKYYHPGVTEAVARELGRVRVWDGFWAAKKGEGWCDELELDLADTRVPEHIRAAVESEKLDLVEETEGYNFIKLGDFRYLALAKTLGAVEPFVERVGERDLWPLVLTAGSLEEVRRKAAGGDVALRALRDCSPRLVGEHRGFNLVEFQGKAYGLRQSLGEVDVSVGAGVLARRYSPDDVIVAKDIPGVIAAIERQASPRGRSWWRRRWWWLKVATPPGGGGTL